MTAKRYRKKPVVIEAMQFTGSSFNREEVLAFTGASANSAGRCLIISTLEGQMLAHPGDWIIKGIAGEFYPCKPDIFDKTYEPEKPPFFVFDSNKLTQADIDNLAGTGETQLIGIDWAASAEIGDVYDATREGLDALAIERSKVDDLTGISPGPTLAALEAEHAALEAYCPQHGRARHEGCLSCNGYTVHDHRRCNAQRLAEVGARREGDRRRALGSVLDNQAPASADPWMLGSNWRDEIQKRLASPKPKVEPLPDWRLVTKTELVPGIRPGWRGVLDAIYIAMNWRTISSLLVPVTFSAHVRSDKPVKLEIATSQAEVGR